MSDTFCYECGLVIIGGGDIKCGKCRKFKRKQPKIELNITVEGAKLTMVIGVDQGTNH